MGHGWARTVSDDHPELLQVCQRCDHRLRHNEKVVLPVGGEVDGGGAEVFRKRRSCRPGRQQGGRRESQGSRIRGGRGDVPVHARSSLRARGQRQRKLEHRGRLPVPCDGIKSEIKIID